MKECILVSFLVLFVSRSRGQTFDECARSYLNDFNEIQMQYFRKEMDRKMEDSLISVAEATLDNCIIGKEISDFTLTGLSGKVYTKESLKGKIVQLNFWALSCGPCIAEIPALNSVSLAYRDKGYVLISILDDSQKDLLKFMQGRVVKRSINYEVVPGAKQIRKDTFKIVTIFPTNIFIDRDGKIFNKTVGAMLDSNDQMEFEEKLKHILNDGLVK